MSITRDEFLHLVSVDKDTTWVTCPPVYDSETWPIECLVAGAWEDCWWDDRLPEPISFDSSHPSSRFGVLNLLYRIATHSRHDASTALWQLWTSEQTESGCALPWNGCSVFYNQLKTAVQQVHVSDFGDLDALRWETSVAATTLMWERFEALIDKWAAIEEGEPRFAALLVRLQQSLYPHCTITEWGEHCYEMLVGPRLSRVPVMLRVAMEQQPYGDAQQALRTALLRYQNIRRGAVEFDPEEQLGQGLAEYVAGECDKDKGLLLSAALRFRKLADVEWVSPIDCVEWPQILHRPLSQTEQKRGRGSASMSSDCFWAACRCAEKASDLGLWHDIADEWRLFDLEKADSARALARCFVAKGQYEVATGWAVRAFELEPDQEDELQVTHFLHLATTSRLDLCGRLMMLTTAGLGAWVERKLRPIYKDNWRRTGLATNGTPAGETPDLLELQRLVTRNRSIFRTTSIVRVEATLARLVRLRNKLAHQQAVSSTDIQNGLADGYLLLREIAAPQAADVAALIEGLP